VDYRRGAEAADVDQREADLTKPEQRRTDVQAGALVGHAHIGESRDAKRLRRGPGEARSTHRAEERRVEGVGEASRRVELRALVLPRPERGRRTAELALEFDTVLDIVAIVVPGHVEVGIVIRAVEGQRRHLVLVAT